jgi:hypothetical protein
MVYNNREVFPFSQSERLGLRNYKKRPRPVLIGKHEEPRSDYPTLFLPEFLIAKTEHLCNENGHFYHRIKAQIIHRQGNMA